MALKAFEAFVLTPTGWSFWGQATECASALARAAWQSIDDERRAGSVGGWMSVEG